MTASKCFMFMYLLLPTEYQLRGIANNDRNRHSHAPLNATNSKKH